MKQIEEFPDYYVTENGEVWSKKYHPIQNKNCELRKLKNIFTSSKLNFINIYADPSHIIDSEEFFKIISSFSIYNIMSFEEIKI